MEYLDVDLEIGAGLGRDYPVVVRSKAGEAWLTMRFPYDKVMLESRLKDLRIALLQSLQPFRKALSEEERAVQDFGRTLFESLLAGEARTLYDVSRDRAAQEGRPGVRLRLRIQAPELAALPWEYLFDPRQDDYLCLSRGTPLVRYPELASPIQPLAITPPLRILGMMASPSDMDPLEVEREQGRLHQALAKLEAEGWVQLTWLAGQTWEDLQEAMWKGPWHVFHFIGHGGFDQRSEEGTLALTNEQGKAHLLSATHLARLLTNHRALRLVILNACEGAKGGSSDIFSSTAATLARRGIPAVLAMQESITDEAAIQLTRTFYRALANGLPVDAAVAEARTAISVSLRHSLEWGTPVLFLRTFDSILFTLSGTPTPPVPTPARPPAQAEEKSSEKDEYLKEGDVFYHREEYEQALAAYEQAIALAPTYVHALYGKANTLWQLKRFEEAVTYYSQVLELNPHHEAAQKDREAAIAALKQLEEKKTRPVDVPPNSPMPELPTLPVFGKLLATFEDHIAMVWSVAWSPDGRRLASASADRTARLWDAENYQSLATLKGHNNYMYSVAWSPDGHRLASASADHTVRLWDTQSYQMLSTFKGHTKSVYSVAWSPDGRYLASAGRDHSLLLWDVTVGKAISTLNGHTAPVNAVAWSPDGLRLATAGYDNVVRLWDGVSGQALTTLLGHTGVVQSLAWSPDGNYLASASVDGTVRVWDIASGQMLATLTANASWVRSVAWSPDGLRLASAGEDKTVRLWDAASGKSLAILTGHTNTVTSVRWSPDGLRLASASLDNTVCVWWVAEGGTRRSSRRSGPPALSQIHLKSANPATIWPWINCYSLCSCCSRN